MRRSLLILLVSLWAGAARAAVPARLPADSWATVQGRKQGTVTALWNALDPFLFREAGTGRLRGVEYEVMESFAAYVRRRYGVRLRVEWREVPVFDELLPYVAHSRQAGVFGWGSFSITDARERQVRFTPPYMPDLNVLVTHERVPTAGSAAELLRALRGDGVAYTMQATTMADDVRALLPASGPETPTRFTADDFDILERIAGDERVFGYVPLSVYVVGLQKGLAIKRHPALTRPRRGCAGIYPPGSDWQPVVDEYFGSAEFGRVSQQLLQKYLGTYMSALVAAPAQGSRPADDRELLRLEKEIVSQRFVDAALQHQQSRTYLNGFILVGLLVLVLAGALLGRAVLVGRFNRQLQARNAVIGEQNEAIGRMNRQLEQKVLQGQMNPHFIFNSLNAIQYFVSLDEKRQALHYIAAFARFMRQLLANAANPTTAVADEIRLLEQYLALEQQRFAHKFTFSVEALAPGPELLAARLPSLLLHPFVENALYHGVLNRPDAGGHIRVRFEHTGTELRVAVEDNGAGRQTAAAQQTRQRSAHLTPFAQLAQERLALLNEDTATSIRVQTVDLADEAGGQGTRVEFACPATA
ncbi:histidine kinase [Hymenobacter ruricola]|uniref:Histidine kinase n=1 Tax=Hymenobacter ruricola TaxID=2791023 RepID=A0ABS0I171_9BACT|nr:histidine kinase [Hymenobacter ruricola]MBF9220690.1 histidine kinase [Hymenobacter ruricola]